MDFLPEILGGSAVSILLLLVYRMRGRRALWASAFGLSVMLGWIFYLQSRRYVNQEAPASAHVLAGLVPPMVVARMVVALHGRIPSALSPILGALGYVGAYFGTAVIFTYLIAI